MRRYSLLIPTTLIVSAISVAQAADAPTESTVASDIVIEDSRINLKKEATQAIDLSTKLVPAKPTLESALEGQSNIQVVNSPLGGSVLSLNGLSGEHVAIFRDGDPVLGRVDGALDLRNVQLGTADRVAVYQGLDSLPYGSQNIAGVISLESPWEADPLFQARMAGGNYGRTSLSVKAAGDIDRNSYYSAAVSNWRGDALRATPAAIDTASDAFARLSADAFVSRKNVTVFKGQAVDARLGASGLASETKGQFAGEASSGQDRRVQVFGDLRRQKSNFHLSYNDAFHRWRSDTLNERSVRVGPEIQEAIGDLTLFTGAMADVNALKSSRVPKEAEERVSAGTYLGARYTFNDKWVAGAGTRYDSGPRLLSPRAEVRYLMRYGLFDHTTTLESGLGFREPTGKERYMDFRNPNLGYHVIGNPALRTERAWMTAFRHVIKHKRFTMRASFFQVRVRDAIGFQSEDSSSPVVKYGNISQTLTHGAEWNTEYRFFTTWKTFAGYQWLRGRNLESDSDLFLQPRSRLSLGFGREVSRGFSTVATGTWTGRQGYFDFNRNRKIDQDEWARSYWSASLETGYGFKWSGVAEVMRVFGRVDNAFDASLGDQVFLEPRTFMVGASVDL